MLIIPHFSSSCNLNFDNLCPEVHLLVSNLSGMDSDDYLSVDVFEAPFI